MKKLFFAFLFLSAAVSSPAGAGLGVSAEELYRDFLSDERGNFKDRPDDAKANRKNAKALEILPEEKPDSAGIRATPFELLEENRKPEKEASSPVLKKEPPGAKGYFEDQELELWRQTVVSVQKGIVTPFQLAYIESLVDKKNPDAIELLAWMYANGTGISQNLPNAYALYRQAAALKVESAEKNAAAVYQAMSREEREKIKFFMPAP